MLAPILTTLLAFFIGGLVVLVTTGKNPIATYRAIFEGAGWSWFFEVGSYRRSACHIGDAKVWFPWNVSDSESVRGREPAADADHHVDARPHGVWRSRSPSAAGCSTSAGRASTSSASIFAVWIGSSFTGMSPFLHILLAIVVGTLAGAVWAGIAGFLKATVGAHEVISTIMLNWIAIWVGSFLFGLGGPLQSDTQASVPISNDVVEGAFLSVFWGDPLLQGLHVGFFIAIAALVVYWALLEPHDARVRRPCGRLQPRGGPLRRHRRRGATTSSRWRSRGRSRASPAPSTSSAGSTASRRATSRRSALGFTGIAVALLGRNTAVGVFFAALLFGSLVTGTSTRNLDPEIFQPELASNLSLLIQGLVVLFVGADIIILWLLRRARRLV